MSKICFIDTETTSLRHDRRAWEIAVITRDAAFKDKDIEIRWFIDEHDLDLGNADLMSLKIGRFHERHPGFSDDESVRGIAVPEADALAEVEAMTRGAHLVGAVPSFDAEVLAARMRANGLCPSWHYHLIDIEPLAVGYLYGRQARQNEIVDGFPLENDGQEAPGLVRWNDPPRGVGLPWKSDDLSAALGVKVSEEDRHTALGDAKWARAIYDAVMGRAAS